MLLASRVASPRSGCCPHPPPRDGPTRRELLASSPTVRCRLNNRNTDLCSSRIDVRSSGSRGESFRRGTASQILTLSSETG